MMSERHGNIEVRFLDDGTVDEVVIYGPDGTCVFHLEQMDDHYFWARVYSGGGKDLVLAITSKATGAIKDEMTSPEQDGSVVKITHEWEELWKGGN